MIMSKQDFLESRKLKAHKQVKRVLWTSMFGVRMIAEIKGNKVFISVYYDDKRFKRKSY